MIVMENIKKSLKRDYNLAVQAFNAKDYITFFRNIRPAIELLSKFTIYDLLGDEKLAMDLIGGSKMIIKDSYGYSIYSQKASRKPTGKDFCRLLNNVFNYTCQKSIQSVQTQKRLAISFNGSIHGLIQYYNTASAIGNHTDGTTLNVVLQARVCTGIIAGFFDFFRSNKMLTASSLDFLYSLDEFNLNESDDSELKQARQTIEEKNAEIADRDSALLCAKEQLLEAEKQMLEAQGYTEQIKQQLAENQAELEMLRAKLNELSSIQELSDDEEEEVASSLIYAQNIKSISNNPKLISYLRGNMSDWDPGEEAISKDDDQLDLIELSLDKSMLVSGCAGSGKSVIAMYKAQQIANNGGDVILITLTKSLSGFMQTGKACSSYRLFHHALWKHYGCPSADYVIVDEVQDFEKEDIEEFIGAARKSFFFFGDSAQSIYNQYGRNTLSIEEISDMTGLKPLRLYNNYRLPRSVAKITQAYVGVDVNPYEEKVYQNKEKALPHFIHYENYDAQILAIDELVKEFRGCSIGILLPSNELVLKICESLQRVGQNFEFKYTSKLNDKKGVSTLSFNNSIPKIMTYHSAKGLQFDVVVLPMYEGANDDDARKSLYVAMTRTMHHLYVMYLTDEIKYPLSEVPTRFYLKK